MIEIINYNSYGELEVAWESRQYCYFGFPQAQLKKLRHFLRFKNYRNAIKMLKKYECQELSCSP